MRMKIYRRECEWEHQCTYMHTHKFICMKADAYTCIHICKHICKYTKSYAYICIFMQAYKINGSWQTTVHKLLNLHNSQVLHLQTRLDYSFDPHLNPGTCSVSIYMSAVDSRFWLLIIINGTAGAALENGTVHDDWKKGQVNTGL